jgi:hypothetical protein
VIHTGEVRDVSVSSSSDNCGNIASALGNEGNWPNVAHNREGASERERSGDKVAVADEHTIYDMTRFVARRIIERLEL